MIYEWIYEMIYEYNINGTPTWAILSRWNYMIKTINKVDTLNEGTIVYSSIWQRPIFKLDRQG